MKRLATALGNVLRKERKELMKHRRLMISIVLTSLAPQLLGAASNSAVLDARKAALKAPHDAGAIESFTKSLPFLKELDAYVLEGDILVKSGALSEYLLLERKAARPAQPSPELILNYIDGEPDVWSSTRRGHLSYAVDKASFGDNAEQYAQVKDNVSAAAQEWESACTGCGVKFEYRPGDDTAPTFDKEMFIVKKLDAQGDFIAMSFFPSTPVDERYLYIEPSYFKTTFDHIGVLRHELGHVLGYRHEHIGGVPGCASEGGEWKPITPYNPLSVMHYFCGGGGSMKLDITGSDRQGHQKAYHP
jgi:hypothetical protein